MISDGQRVIQRRMSYLLLTIILLMTFILQEVEQEIPALDFVFAFVILATIYVAGSERNWLIAAIILAIPTLALSAVSNLDAWPLDNISILYLVFLCTFVGFAIVAVIREVLLADRITIHTISGAIVVYLLIGLLWAFMFYLAEGQFPGSFSITQELNPNQDVSSALFADLTYFSLITLTSTGYGDISPIADWSRTLAALEAILGQIFLAVLVAWLVGKFLSHQVD
jgi:voltage-gated potassium channel